MKEKGGERDRNVKRSWTTEKKSIWRDEKHGNSKKTPRLGLKRDADPEILLAPKTRPTGGPKTGPKTGTKIEPKIGPKTGSKI